MASLVRCDTCGAEYRPEARGYRIECTAEPRSWGEPDGWDACSPRCLSALGERLGSSGPHLHAEVSQ